MTDPQLSMLLRDATSELDPDIRAIVDGGVRRGRRRARTQAFSTCVGSLILTAGLAGVVASELGGHQRAVDPDVADVPTAPTSSRASAPNIPPLRELAVAPERMVATFTQLVGGTTFVEPQKEPGQTRVEFLWNGFATTLAFRSPQEQAGFESPQCSVSAGSDRCRDLPVRPRKVVPRTAMQRCLAAKEEGGGGECRPGTNGSVTAALSEKPRRGAVTTNFVKVHSADGWEVSLVISNSNDKEGTAIADQPPLTLEEMIAVAQNDIWFR